MFCPKCHTELDDNTQTCRRCGTKVDSKSTNNLWSSFSSSKTFERMNSVKQEKEENVEEVKEEVNLDDHNEEHQTQYDYSKNYSNVKNDEAKQHQEQYNYSKNYSNVENDEAKEHQEQYSYSQNYSNTIQEQVTSDQDYIDAYIGNKAFFNIPFSIPAVLLGPFYFLYRKMFSTGIILIILYVASYIYLNENLGLMLRLLMNIFLAFTFNKKYIEDAEKKVQIIKNQNASSTELLEICKKKGKPLSLGILFVIIILYFTTIAALLVNDPKTKEELTNIKETYSVGNLQYKIPKGIEEADEYTNYQYFKDKNDKGTCFISIYLQNTNMSEKEFIVAESTSYNLFKQSDITPIEINKYKWSTRTFDGTEQKTQMFVIKKENNKLYELNFDEQPASSDACSEVKDYILNNLEIK